VLPLKRVTNELTEILHKYGCVDVIYLYFQKAFDTVLTKLSNYGVNGKVLDWIDPHDKQKTTSGSKWCILKMDRSVEQYPTRLHFGNSRV